MTKWTAKMIRNNRHIKVGEAECAMIRSDSANYYPWRLIALNDAGRDHRTLLPRTAAELAKYLNSIGAASVKGKTGDAVEK